MPNSFAYLVLFSWPVVVWVCFGSMRPVRATFIGIVGAFMVMPELKVDLPVLPPLGKETVPGAAVMVAAFFAARAQLRHAGPLSGLNRLVLVLMAGAVGTVLTNGEPVWDGRDWRNPLVTYDIASILVRDMLFIYFPFLIGCTFYRTSNDLQELTRAFLIAGLIYAPLCLIEIRLSPQLHSWVYGYFPHSFAQTKRGGGFRPVVFMGHGLTVARFMVTVVLAAAVAYKTRAQPIAGIPRGVMLIGMVILLLLCKTLGAFVLATVAWPLILWTQPRTQMRVAVLLGALVMILPPLRAWGLVPTEKLVEWSAEVSLERAASLEFRFENEDMLLAHALERPLLGWGGYGRNKAILIDDAAIDSVTDGEWIIVLGMRGIVGFIAVFGLYVGPIWVASRAMRRLRSQRDRLLLSSLAITTAVLAVDLIPNSALSFPQTFLSGALYGLAKGLSASADRAARAPAAALARSAA